MKIFLLTVLTIGCVPPLTRSSPHHAGYWSYNPAQSEFPAAQDQLRYFDNNGNERFVGYSYPEPVYGVRRLSFVDGISTPVYKTYNQNEVGELAKASEAHFRIWAVQQYQALKCEVDALRAQGKEPSADMLLKFKPLEKIALSADYSTIAELPEIKRLREDHSRIWNQQRIQGSQTDQQWNSYNNQGEIKTYAGQTTTTLVSPKGTEEQKKAHEEHLRIHNEQVASLKKLESEYQQHHQNKDFPLRISQLEQKPVEQQYTDAITQLERAKQEHLSLKNEAILRAEQGLKDTIRTGYEDTEKQHLPSFIPSEQQQQQVVDTPEVMKAREEHLRLVNEANLRAQQELKLTPQSIIPSEQQQQQHQVVDTPEVMKAREEHLRLVNEANLKAQQELKLTPQSIISSEQQQQQVVDTPEVMKARDEHLRLVNEANLRAQQELKLTPQSMEQPMQQTDVATEFGLRSELQDTAGHSKAQEEHLRLLNEATLKLQAAEAHIEQLTAQSISQYLTQSNFVADTPEVIKARREYLRLLNEANLRAEQHRQQELKYTPQSGFEQQTLKSSIPVEQHQVVDTPEVMKAREEHLRLVNEANLRAKQEKQHEFKHTPQSGFEQQTLKSSIPVEQHQVVDTPEVMKAREEHLRLVNEANLRAKQEKQHDFKHTPQSGFEQQTFKSSIPVEQHQVVDTPEVIKAREEHLRLVNEANLRAQQLEQQALKYTHEKKQEFHQESIRYPQQHEQWQSIQDTPAVIKAREEHLRLVNEAKLNAKGQKLHLEQQTNQPLFHEHQSQSIQDTPEVIKAREEHFRLVNEAKQQIKTEDHSVQYHTEPLRSDFPQQYQANQQSFTTIQNIQDTPEVQQAREEHLRLFNAIKSNNEQEVSKAEGQLPAAIFQPLTNDDKILEATRLKDEQLILELENSREAQNLKEEQKRLELEQMMEAQRLADEQRQMEAELQRLKMDEEQRLEMERIVEAKRLEQEQEELQKQLRAELQIQQEDQQYLNKEQAGFQTRFQNEENNQSELKQTLTLTQPDRTNVQYYTEQQLNLKSHLPQEYQTHQIVQHSLGAFSNDKPLDKNTQNEQRLLELEGLRQAEQLQDEHRRSEWERMQEAERLDKEQRQMEAELQRLKMEDEQRLEMERILEAKRLKEEQEELAEQETQQPITKSVQQTQSPKLVTQYQPQDANTLYFKTSPVSSEIFHQQQQGFYTYNPFLKTSTIRAPIAYLPPAGLSNAVLQSSNTALPIVRYVQSSQLGNIAFETAEYDQLDALEKAKRDHFRAHDLALEQLRLANLKNPKIKDCD